MDNRLAALQLQANEHERAIAELGVKVQAIPELTRAVSDLTASINKANGAMNALKFLLATTSTGAAFIGWLIGKKQ